MNRNNFLWQKLNLHEATFQIDTGNKSIHSYWVLKKPSPVEDWKSLQTDLLEFSDGDRSIKNPSRVMRVPGFVHPKSGNVAEIISQSGKRYSYEELRQAIPTQQIPTLNFSQAPTTHLDSVPLEKCLSKDDRALIDNGEGEGKRNNSGAKLARNLIGTAKRLDYLGHPYRGDPHQLFLDFCSRCAPQIDSKEAQQIWNSAEKSNLTATLKDDALENCVKAWHHQNRQQKNPTTSPSPKPLCTDNLVELPLQLNDTQVEQAIYSLAEARPKKSKLSRELKKLSQQSQWSPKELRELYFQIVEEQDKEAELEDDIGEFEEILNSNEPLPCSKILHKNLHPLLEFTKNLGVNPEPALVTLEATIASLIDPQTRIVGRKCSDYKEVPVIFSAIVGEPGSKKSPIINKGGSTPSSDCKNIQTQKVTTHGKRDEVKVAVDGTKVAADSATCSNKVDSGSSPASHKQGDTKMTGGSSLNTVMNAPKGWRDVTAPSSDTKNTQNSHGSINDFKIGQKVRVDNLQGLVFKIDRIDFEKGFLRDEEDTAFRWQRCRVVNDI